MTEKILFRTIETKSIIQLEKMRRGLYTEIFKCTKFLKRNSTTPEKTQELLLKKALLEAQLEVFKILETLGIIGEYFQPTEY